MTTANDQIGPRDIEITDAFLRHALAEVQP